VGWLLGLGVGLMLLILASTGMQGDDFTLATAFGVDSLLFSVFCFAMMLRTTFAGWYRYLIRPLLLTACVQTVVAASIMLGDMNLANDEQAIATFFIVFPAILFFVVLFTPARLFGAPPVAAKSSRPIRVQTTPSGPASPGKRLTALLLALLGPMFMFGLCGLQRFYVGKIGTGILWLFTGGLMGIGQFIDIILIAAGQFKDRNGLPLVLWHGEDEVAMATASGEVRPVAAAPPAPAVPRVAEDVEAAEAAPQAQAQPAAYPAPSWPSYGTTTSVYQPWDPIGGLFAAVGHILTLAALLIGLAVGLHLPAVAAAAWPDAEPVQELAARLGTEWPGVAEQAGVMLIFVLLFLAAILIMVGRRKSGPMHLVRALLGLGGFFWAIRLFDSEAISKEQVRGIVDLMQQNQMGPALERLFGAFSQEEAIFAGVILLVSVLMLSWPPRRRTPFFGPLPNQQGVIL
jgi:hypothetical protein